MKKFLSSFVFLFLLSLSLLAFAANPLPQTIRGIYVTQSSLEDTAFLKYLISNAKTSGINTFVIDLDKPSHRYEQNIQLVIKSGIAYVARIVMFPGGGSPEQINSEAFWQQKYALVKAAVGYGASQIQLDYIRYNTHRGASTEHAKNITKIISWYKKKLAANNIPLEVDVFGISSFEPENHIGQNLQMMSQTVDVLCPMVYPSHYVPFREHFNTPYETVYDSLTAIKDQLGNKMQVKLVPYIELSNYHYPLSQTKKIAYIEAQLKAVHDAGADGWYAWSPNNIYETLFKVLQMQKSG